MRLGSRLAVLLDDGEQQARPVEEVLHAQASVLKGFGWQTVTVLHRSWYANPALVLQRLEAALAVTADPRPEVASSGQRRRRPQRDANTSTTARGTSTEAQPQRPTAARCRPPSRRHRPPPCLLLLQRPLG